MELASQGYRFLYTFAQIFAIAFISGISGAIMPGPLLAFTVNSAARRGPKVGVLVVIGHAVVESTLVVLIFVGAAAFLTNVTVLKVLGGAGAAVLAFMAAMMFRDAARVSLSAILSQSAPPSKIEHPVLGGILLTALNPTFAPWWAGLGFAMITKYGTTVPNLVFFYAGHITSDLLWYCTVSSVVGRGREIISDRMYRAFICACALFMLALAAMFAWSAVEGPEPRARAAAVESAVPAPPAETKTGTPP